MSMYYLFFLRDELYIHIFFWFVYQDLDILGWMTQMSQSRQSD